MTPCIVIPFYNHQGTIAKLLDLLKPLDLPCILVNDGSSVEASAVVQELNKKHTWLTLVELPENRGKGGAVCAGFREAHQQGFTHALQIDADLQHQIDDIPKFITMGQKHPEKIILGKPVYDESVPKGRLYGRYITHFFVWLETLSFSIKDSMCGFRLYPLEPTLELLDKKQISQRMEFDIEILVRLYWQGLEMQTIDTQVLYPEDGVSHFHLWRENWLISKMHSKLCFAMIPRIPKLLFRRPQKQNQNWHQQEESGTAWGLKFTILFYKVFGRRLCTLLLYPIIGYFFLSNAKARTHSQNYLTRLAHTDNSLFPNGVKLRHSFSHLMSFAKAILDKFAFWMGRLKIDNTTWENREGLYKQLDTGKGGLILGAHLGNIEIVRALVNDIERFKVNVVMDTRNAQSFNKLLKSMNKEVDFDIIEADSISIDTAIRLQEKISQGEFVAVMADRITEGAQSRQTEVDFLGGKATLPQGPFILASLLECPVFLVFCLREKSSHYKVFVEEFAERLKFPRKEREQALQKSIQQYAKRLEYYCQQAPYQWFNFFNFWQ